MRRESRQTTRLMCSEGRAGVKSPCSWLRNVSSYTFVAFWAKSVLLVGDDLGGR